MLVLPKSYTFSNLIMMLAFYILILFLAMRFVEATCSSFISRKVTHILAGIVLLLVPFPLGWLSKGLIAGFSTFVVYRTIEANTPALVEKVNEEEAKANRVQESELHRAKDATETVAARGKGVAKRSVLDLTRKSLQNADLGILLFAIGVNMAAFLNLPYKWLAPLFIGDPLAAVIGTLTKQLPEGTLDKMPSKKSWSGSLAYFTAALMTIYYQWVPPALQQSSQGWTMASLGALVSTMVEYLAGSSDNLALAISGLLFSRNFTSILDPRVLAKTTLLQGLSAVGLRRLVEALVPAAMVS